MAGASFPISAGTLFFSVTDPSGNRSTQSLTIDPSTQSLDDVAALIDGIPNLNSSIDPQTNRLQISSVPGFRFDFTGSLEDIPDLSNYSGTAVPEFSGEYRGENNGTYNFEVLGSGTVGVTNGLTLAVTDANGNLIQNLNIGAGYEAGTPIEIADGVEITLGTGNVVAGDTLATPVVAEPDETGILSAIGLNSFFLGDDAATIAVDARITDDPLLFSSSLNGDSADSTKIFDFTQLRDEKTLGDGRLSFSEFLIEITTDIGSRVQTDQRLATNLQLLVGQYESERDSISGVDVNEEFVRLTQFQRSYEAAVRVIQTAESVLDELFSIIR